MFTCGNPTCKERFYRSPHDVRKVTGIYCSQSCAARINNKKFPKREACLGTCAGNQCGTTIRGTAKYCSVECRRAAEHTDPGKLTEALKRIAHTLGRTPAKREAMPITESCIYTFGSWNNAVIAAGLNPHRSDSQRMYKRTNTVAIDGHKCDSISEAIVDNWLTKNNISHLRNAPYPGTGHRADWGIRNKVFIEYFGLAHDSPRYDRSIQEKRKLCKKHSIKLIEIYPTDLYPTIKLENKFKPLL